jgi:hypothetical protein
MSLPIITLPPISTCVLMVGALAYGLYNLWRLSRRTDPPRLCGTLRYLLGYWVGSILYALGWVIIPLFLFALLVISYFFSGILENPTLNHILDKLLN